MKCWVPLLLVLCAPAYSWGPQGHRVAAYIAEDWLTPAAAASVRELLGSQTLAEASTWADEMRGNPSPFWQEQAGSYHYVTVPPGKRYTEVGAPKKGDAVTALTMFRATLNDPSAARTQQQLALRFSIHIVQDLHQPLHVGNGNDRGGTRYYVIQDFKRQNLHWLWDSGLFRAAGYSDKRLLARLRANRDLQEEGRWLNPDPLQWVSESAQLRDEIYPPEGKQISSEYLRQSVKKAEQRLHMAGVRTAAYLNALFDPQASRTDKVTSTGL